MADLTLGVDTSPVTLAGTTKIAADDGTVGGHTTAQALADLPPTALTTGRPSTLDDVVEAVVVGGARRKIALNELTPEANPRRFYHWRYDFNSMAASFGDGFTGVATGTGAGHTQLAGETNAWGIAMLSTGTTTTGADGLHVLNLLKLSGARSRFGARVRLANLSDGTDTYTFRLKFGTSAGAESADAVGFRYTHGTNGGRFQGYTRASSSETTVDTGVAVVANTWFYLEWEINAAGNSVQFYVNGVATGAPITTTIPTAALGPVVSIIKSAGTTNRIAHIDFWRIDAEFAADLW